MTTEEPTPEATEPTKRRRTISRAAEEALAAEPVAHHYGGLADHDFVPSAPEHTSEPTAHDLCHGCGSERHDHPDTRTALDEALAAATGTDSGSTVWGSTPVIDPSKVLDHAFQEPANILADATTKLDPTDICPQCGWSRADHPDYDPSLFGESPIRVNSGDANATEGTAAPRKRRGKASEEAGTAPSRNAQGELPGVPSSGIWGEYQNRRIAYVKLGFGGGPGAPRELAGHLDLSARVWLHISGVVAGNQHKRDKEGDTYEAVSLFVDTVSVDKFEEPPAAEMPSTLMRKAVLLDFVTRALTLMKVGPDEGEGGMTAAAWELVGDISRAFDPSEVAAEASE